MNSLIATHFSKIPNRTNMVTSNSFLVSLPNMCLLRPLLSPQKPINHWSVSSLPTVGVVRNVSSTFRPGNAKCSVTQSQSQRPTSVPVRVAHELLLAGHKYLDVRTSEEFSAGHAPGAINVPYMFKVGSGMSKNPNFVAQVLSNFRKDDEIIVGCQLGKRSMMAAIDLAAAGFSGITDIAGGYASWTQTGLPIET